MNVDTLSWLFSHVCGQARCFVVDGAALPVCQRCLGLYAGASLTAGWLVVCRLWRAGLPPRSVIAVNSVMLIAALLGGIHAIDIGPVWRLMCGLWTGHVVMLWLVCGAGELRRLARPAAASATTWGRMATASALAAGPLLAALACGLPRLLVGGWFVWTGLAAIGLVCLACATAAAAFSIGAWFLRATH